MRLALNGPLDGYRSLSVETALLTDRPSIVLGAVACVSCARAGPRRGARVRSLRARSRSKRASRSPSGSATRSSPVSRRCSPSSTSFEQPVFVVVVVLVTVAVCGPWRCGGRRSREHASGFPCSGQGGAVRPCGRACAPARRRGHPARYGRQTSSLAIRSSWRYWADGLEVAAAGHIPAQTQQWGTEFPTTVSKAVAELLRGRRLAPSRPRPASGDAGDPHRHRGRARRRASWPSAASSGSESSRHSFRRSSS